MEAWILDENFDSVSIVDDYESFIWTDRYDQYGDFEIYINATPEVRERMKQGYYLWKADSEHMMIIEDVKTDMNVEDGNKLLVAGRSLESILDRRIVWKMTTIDGNLQNGIKKLINENIINPGVAARKISNFIFEDSTDPKITKLTLTAQYTGDGLYDVICDICQNNKIGFKITMNNNKQFVFKLYTGVDRTYDQVDVPYVKFSPDFENIIQSNYLESTKTLKNVTLVAGEGEDNDRKTFVVGNTTGLARRELYTDARDISSTDENNNTISTTEYNKLLETRGKENLAENKTTKTFEGEVDTSRLFIYGRDFYMGDLVQLVDIFGIERQSRIIEMVMKNDKEGYSAYPTFYIIND